MKAAGHSNGHRRSCHPQAQRRSLSYDADSRMLQFLTGLQAEQYFAAFQREEIRFEDLPLLTRNDLRDMGVPIGPARRILAAAGADQEPQSTGYPDPQDAEEPVPAEIPQIGSQGKPTFQEENTSASVAETAKERSDFDPSKGDVFSQALKTLSLEQQGMLRMMQELQAAISELQQLPIASEPDLSPSQLQGQDVSFDNTRSSTSTCRDAPDISLRLRSHTLSSLAKQRRLPNKYMRVSNLRMSYLLRSQLGSKAEE